MSDNAAEEQRTFMYPKFSEERLKTQLRKALGNTVSLTKPKATGYVGEAHRVGIRLEETSLLDFWRDVERFAQERDVVDMFQGDIARDFLSIYGAKYWGPTSPYKASSSGFRYPPDNGELKTPLWSALKRLWRYKLQLLHASRLLQCQERSHSAEDRANDEADSDSDSDSDEAADVQPRPQRRIVDGKQVQEEDLASDENVQQERRLSPYVRPDLAEWLDPKNGGFKFVVPPAEDFGLN